MSLRKVVAGEPLRLPASMVNEWTKAAEYVREQKSKQGGGPLEPTPRQTGICKVRNNSGIDLGKFAILGVGAPVILPTANQSEFERQVFFEGATPVAGTHEGKFVVLLEPIPDGEIGRAVIDGVVSVQLAVADDDHTRAEIEDTETATLASGTTGSAQILWMEGSGATRRAIVRLGDASSWTPPDTYTYTDIHWTINGGDLTLNNFELNLSNSTVNYNNTTVVGDPTWSNPTYATFVNAVCHWPLTDWQDTESEVTVSDTLIDVITKSVEVPRNNTPVIFMVTVEFNNKHIGTQAGAGSEFRISFYVGGVLQDRTASWTALHADHIGTVTQFWPMSLVAGTYAVAVKAIRMSGSGTVKATINSVLVTHGDSDVLVSTRLVELPNGTIVYSPICTTNPTDCCPEGEEEELEFFCIHDVGIWYGTETQADQVVDSYATTFSGGFESYAEAEEACTPGPPLNCMGVPSEMPKTVYFEFVTAEDDFVTLQGTVVILHWDGGDYWLPDAPVPGIGGNNFTLFRLELLSPGAGGGTPSNATFLMELAGCIDMTNGISATDCVPLVIESGVTPTGTCGTGEIFYRITEVEP